MKKYCKKCGFVDGEGDIDICPICKSTDWEDADLITIKEISTDKDFLEAMIELKKNDPIEYQLKMSQFKANLKQQEQVQESRVEENKPRCPTCGSTNIQKISGTKRWFSTGLFGLASSDIGKSMCCKKCGYKW